MRQAMGRALLLLLCTAVAGLAQQERHPVQARLVPHAEAIAPGAAVDVAVVLDMDPGWHTYWEYSGDAGLPTRVTWRLPEGVTAGPLRFPGPHRYTESGDLTVFGYGERTALFTRLDLPTPLPDTLRVSAQVSWLVCEAICIPGDTLLTWTHARGTPLPDRSDLLDPFAATLPQPLSDADGVRTAVSVTDLGGGRRQVEVRVEAPRGDAGEHLPDFFPLPPADYAGYVEAGDRTEHSHTAATSSMELVPSAGTALLTELDGVLALAGVDGEATYRAVTLRLPEAGPAFRLQGADFAAASGADTPLWTYLLMAVLGGLILNLMPCVLPVISLKVMSLVSQAGESRARVRQLGLAFSAGLLATFVVLAGTVILLQAGGERLGWGFQFQSPGFVFVLSGLIFVLGLSLFGVVTIRLPGGGGSFGSLSEGEGLGSSFFNGVLATILATPCTAPFLGAALGFAFSQSPATILAIFGAAGLGMALPYLVLAWQPAWVSYLPQPGAWMERFKQAMGFLLMGTVLWLLWVLGKQLGMEAVVWTCAFLLCLAVGAWILGSWVDLRSSGRQRAVAWMVSLGLAVAGYAFFLRPLLTAPAPTAPVTGELSEWEPYSPARVEELIGGGRTVFIDFTAEWCWTCKVNERTVLAADDVRAAFAAHDVALVKADWTLRDPQITDLLRAFGRSGVPLYVFFPAGRPDDPIVLPEVITGGILLDALERAAGG